MRESGDPSLLAAAVWEQAAAKVGTLVREGVDAEVEAWNDAIRHAVALLRREAGDVRTMGRMARMLITGNTGQQE